MGGGSGYPGRVGGLLAAVFGGAPGRDPGANPLLQAVVRLLAHREDPEAVNGTGLDDLLTRMDDAGLGDQARSWVATGRNQPVSGKEITDALGEERVQGIAHQVGLSKEETAAALAATLPRIIDAATPDGEPPSEATLSVMLYPYTPPRPTPPKPAPSEATPPPEAAEPDRPEPRKRQPAEPGAEKPEREKPEADGPGGNEPGTGKPGPHRPEPDRPETDRPEPERPRPDLPAEEGTPPKPAEPAKAGASNFPGPAKPGATGEPPGPTVPPKPAGPPPKPGGGRFGRRKGAKRRTEPGPPPGGGAEKGEEGPGDRRNDDGTPRPDPEA